MMSSETGYAMALMKASLAGHKVAQVSEDLPVIEELLTRYTRFFLNPRITPRCKADVLKELLDGRADALTVQFVILLAQRGNLKYLPGIRRKYDKMSEAALGRVSVRLWVPYGVSGELLHRLQAHLADIGLYPADRKDGVHFDIIIDKSLIGGFIAESGGRMLNMSLKSRLSRLRRT